MYAEGYPIGRVIDESRIVTERVNGLVATQALLTKQAIDAVLSKKGHKVFTETLKRLNEGE